MRPIAPGTSDTTRACIASSSSSSTPPRCSPLTRPSTARSNSRPSTDASVSSALQSSERWRRRRPIVSRTLCGISSRPSLPISRATSPTNSGLPSVSAWTAATSSAGTNCATSVSVRPPSGSLRVTGSRARAESVSRSGSVSVGVHVAVGADDQDPAVGELAGHELQQQQRGLVGGVQVVEHEHERLRRRGALQERGERVEEPEARALGLDGGDGRQVGQDRAQLGQQLRDVDRAGAELGAQRLHLGAADVRAQRLHPRPVRGRAARLPAAPDEHLRAARPGPRGQLLREPALADPRLADEQAQAPAARDRVVEAGGELGELALTPDERARHHLGCRRGGHGRQVQPRVLGENRLLELPQALARLDPELVGQRAAGVAVGLQRVGLAVAAVQREHQLRAQALAVRVLGDQALEPFEQVCVLTQRELGLREQLQDGHAQVFQAQRLTLREPLVREIRERRAAPQGERVLERFAPRSPDGPPRARRGRPRGGARSGAASRAPASSCSS